MDEEHQVPQQFEDSSSSSSAQQELVDDEDNSGRLYCPATREDAVQGLALLSSPTPAMNYVAPAAMQYGSDNSGAMDEMPVAASVPFAMLQASGDERQLYRSATREDATQGLALLSSLTSANSEAMDVDSDAPLLPQPQQSMDAESNASSSSSSSSSKLPCPFPDCKAILYNKQILERHLPIHNPNRRKFPCTFPGCNKDFVREAVMRRHQERCAYRDVPQSPRYSCKVEGCTATFTRRDSVLQHVEQTHNQNQPKIKCTFPNCIQDFSNRSNLRRHIRNVHAAEPQS